MFSQRLKLDQPRPHFAEIPYYLWGQIYYDSEGDCKKPTDRQWSWMYLEHRETGEVINVKRDDNGWVIEGDRTATSRLTRFFVDRCGAAPDGDLDESAPDGDHAAGLARAARVAAEFAQPALAPFDSHFFWGSWKWIGWYATAAGVVFFLMIRPPPRTFISARAARGINIRWVSPCISGGVMCTPESRSASRSLGTTPSKMSSS